MSTYLAMDQIPITPMLQLAEAVDKEDDWTGLTDAVSRRKKQTRLNTRAWRRRKALESKAHHTSIMISETYAAENELEIPCWDEEKQTVITFPASVANEFYRTRNALLPWGEDILPNPAALRKQKGARIIFPLSSDHLMTLLQFNVLRASIINRKLVDGLFAAPPRSDCSSGALHVLNSPSLPQSVPPSLMPTALQLTVPHEDWIDIIPHPIWRDNVILAIGTFDEDELWSDIIGGLFEGFPSSECERRGLIAWSPPWHVSGWEVSEGFLRRWGRLFKDCGEVLEATNRRRMERGEEPILFEI